MTGAEEGLAFEILRNDPQSLGRRGRLHTPHGIVETPNFIFCGTKASIKGLSPAQVREAGADIILANTYHLMLQPGPDVIDKMGGLHRFMGWDGPMLTDSGGFQIFSLGHGWVADEVKGRAGRVREKKLLKITEEGATFRSYIDGSLHHLGPGEAIQIQRQLGADLMVAFDECPPFHVDKTYTEKSMHLSHRWEARSLDAFDQSRRDDRKQGLYGIIHGGVYPELRQLSAQWVGEQPFFGQAVGGCLGGTREQMHEVVAMACEYKRPDRPTHLLGIGGIADLWNGAALGIDTFDCVHPTRLARHGGALIRPALNGGRDTLNLKNARFRDDPSPLDEETPSYASSFSRAYIHHLLKAGEHLGGQLLTIHNLAFMARLAADIRKSLDEDTFTSTRKFWVES